MQVGFDDGQELVLERTIVPSNAGELDVLEGALDELKPAVLIGDLASRAEEAGGILALLKRG